MPHMDISSCTIWKELGGVGETKDTLWQWCGRKFSGICEQSVSFKWW